MTGYGPDPTNVISMFDLNYYLKIMKDGSFAPLDLNPELDLLSILIQNQIRLIELIQPESEHGHCTLAKKC